MTDRATLRQVLEIVDMFEDENKRIAADIVLLNPTFKRAIDRDPEGFERDGFDALESADRLDLLEKKLVKWHAHTALTARMIANAIRERYGLPAKQDDD